jgi:hypothetical protein
MEDIPLDVVKDTLLLLNVGDLLHICQSDMRLYNICQSDEFWFQYLINKHKDIPIDVIRTLRNEYIGYKQMAMELDDGIVVKVLNSFHEHIGYKIVNYNKSFNDNFLRMVQDASNINNVTILKGKNWQIVTPHVSYPKQTNIHDTSQIFPEVEVGYQRFKIPKHIPMKDIPKTHFDIRDLKFVQFFPDI